MLAVAFVYASFPFRSVQVNYKNSSPWNFSLWRCVFVWFHLSSTKAWIMISYDDLWSFGYFCFFFFFSFAHSIDIVCRWMEINKKKKRSEIEKKNSRGILLSKRWTFSMLIFLQSWCSSNACLHTPVHRTVFVCCCCCFTSVWLAKIIIESNGR